MFKTAHEHHKTKIKIIIAFSILFLTISILLLLIFFAGKKTYVVRFDLNGGTLISGSLEQHITQGQNAVPPVVVKDGSYLRTWSGSYQKVTKDATIKAIWEYETTSGIIYADSSNRNFTEIAGAYDYLRGDVYLGAYYGDKKILGIKANAFLNHDGITNVYMLNGILNIGDSAFDGCSSITNISVPETVTDLGARAFAECTNIESVTLREGLLSIGSEAFKNCVNLKEIVIPSSVERIGANAFEGCTSLERVVLYHGIEYIDAEAFKNCRSLTEIVIPTDVIFIGKNAFAGCKNLTINAFRPEKGFSFRRWADGWNGNARVIWTSQKINGFFKYIKDFDIFPQRPFNPDIKFPSLDDIKPEIETDIETDTEFEAETGFIRDPHILRPPFKDLEFNLTDTEED